MSKLKVMTILGTRPEIIRLSETIKACDKEFDHILVHTGQNYAYELSDLFFEELHLRKPDFFLHCVGKNLGETMGNILSKSFDLINQIKPDAILILGDTNSALSAISAKRLKTPIFHMEAGNRCWDWNVDEMTNRVIVDHISDINMPYSYFAANNLLHEGLREDRIFVIGSPMYEVIQSHRKEIESSTILNDLCLEKNNYMVMSIQRGENVDDAGKFLCLCSSLDKIAEQFKMPIIFSVHPRTQKQIEANHVSLSRLIRRSEPFGFFDYCKLQENSFCVLSDSGTLTEESSILDFPAVLVRTSTERQEGVIHGSIVVGGITYLSIVNGIKRARARFPSEGHPIVPDYCVPDVSKRVVSQISAESGVIMKETWGKNSFSF